jgi:hypothetical protein
MPAVNDHDEEVSIIEDFLTIDKWVAPAGTDFREIMGTRIVNAKNMDLSGIHGYMPDTYSDFKVKNVLRPNKTMTVCQVVEGPWKDTKMEMAMAQLDLVLNLEDEDNPHLEDENIRVMSGDNELVFSGGWMIRGWKIDLVVNKNKNGIREVEFFRDEIRWIKVPEGQCEPDLSLQSFTSTYWVPY